LSHNFLYDMILLWHTRIKPTRLSPQDDITRLISKK
jgi:hypothetical protein